MSAEIVSCPALPFKPLRPSKDPERRVPLEQAALVPGLLQEASFLGACKDVH